MGFAIAAGLVAGLGSAAAGATAATAIALAGVGVAAGSAYNSYAANKDSADSAEGIAGLNYDASSRSASLELLSSEFSAEYQSKLNDYEAKLAATLYDLDAQEFEVEAQNFESAALTEQNTVKENIRLTREDYDALKSQQRASIAKGNVVEAGSSLDVMAETAGKMEAAIQTQLQESETKQREYFYNAEVARYNAEKSVWLGEQEQYIGSIESEAISLTSDAAKLEYMNDLRAAEIDRLTGLNTARNYDNQATASLLSGVASTASSGYKLAGGGMSYKSV